MQRHHKLNTQESLIIDNKHTEAPGSGEYNYFSKSGIYICKKCDAPLYLSADKFDSGCGWPSFDDELSGAILKEKDADGRRVEILCNNCQGHLGHVFTGEQITKKNTRHCVNSLSVKFLWAHKDINNKLYDRAILAAGCFWGVEYYLAKLKGVKETTVGYIGGQVADPTYDEVCHENTGHKEAIEIIYDPKILSFYDLLKAFFEIHDFTQSNGQGPDIGKQYMSAIYYLTPEQKDIAETMIQKLSSANKFDKIRTQILPASKFYKAEEYHQDYYGKNGKTPYCHVHKSLDGIL